MSRHVGSAAAAATGRCCHHRVQYSEQGQGLGQRKGLGPGPGQGLKQKLFEPGLAQGQGLGPGLWHR